MLISPFDLEKHGWPSSTAKHSEPGVGELSQIQCRKCARFSEGYVCVCVCVCGRPRTSTLHTQVCTYIHTYIHTHTHTHTYTYIHTYIRTHTPTYITLHYIRLEASVSNNIPKSENTLTDTYLYVYKGIDKIMEILGSRGIKLFVLAALKKILFVSFFIIVFVYTV